MATALEAFALVDQARNMIQTEEVHAAGEKRKAEDEAAALRKELASAELVAKKHSRWRMR